MTQEEMKERFDQTMEELKATVIPKVTNATMDAFEKGFNVGFEIGCKVLCDKACKWLANNVTTEYLYAHEEDDYPISYVRAIGSKSDIDFIDKFRKAMEE